MSSLIFPHLETDQRTQMAPELQTLPDEFITANPAFAHTVTELIYDGGFSCRN